MLHSHVRPAVSSGEAALVGALPANQSLQIAVVLPLRNPDELTSLLKRLYDPQSPDYRHFLSVEQFTEQFGPSLADYQAVVAYLQANGFTVTDTPANRLIVPVSGSVAQINRAFNVTMNAYRHPTENREFFSPDREPALNLSVPVAHIAGLNNFSLPHPILTQVFQGQVAANVTGSGPGGSYLGSDMRAAYYGGTTLTGTGQAVGLLEFGGYNLSDVNAVFSNAGQSYSVPINNVLLGGATIAPVEQDGEQVLDIAQAIGMAPGLSQVRVYIGNASLPGQDTVILNSMASENIAKQLSCSWGWEPDDPTTDDVFFQEFAAQGQSFFTASGDAGAFDALINPYFYPSEDAYVTAVGATHLNTNGAAGAWVSESAWNSGGGGSGGGISPDGIAIPSWQTGVANSSNGGSATLRNVPDVAMEGDLDNYDCNLGACNGGYAGTSFATPRWAGFMALVNQQAVEAGTAPMGGLGFLNPALYSIGGGSSFTSDLHDITVGNNHTGSQPVWFNAVTGYDLVTGWGSPTGQSLIDALAGPQVPGFWLESSVGTVGVNPGSSSSTTITVTDAGGFTGSVNLAVTSTLPTGVTASWGTNPTTGKSVLTLTASSSAPNATATVTVTGTSGSLTVTTNFTVSVHTPSFTLAASPGGITVNQGSSSTSTITVLPQYGFTGSVTLAVTSALPTGVTASWGTNPTTGSSVLTLTASSSAPAATANVTITGTSGSLTATDTLSVTITGPTFTLSSSGSLNIGQNSNGTSYVYVYPEYGFSGSVNLAVTGLPSGVTASFSPNPTSTSNNSIGTSILTLTASSTAALGTFTLTITGTSGSLTASTTLTLGVHAPSFTLSAGTVTVGQGTSTSTYVDVSDQYGFTGSVTLAASGLPSGVTASFSPNPTTGSSTLTLTASSSATLGQYNVTITGTSGSLTATTTLTLGVYTPTFTLLAGNVNIGQGTTTSTYVDVSAEYGFTGSVSLTATGLPTGVTASFSPNPTTYSSTITLTASSSAALGQYTVTITGTSGSQTVKTTLTLGVYAPTFTLYAGSANVGQGASTTSVISLSPQYGFSGSVSLSATGLPNGVTASFSPNPTTYSSTLTLTASSTASIGQYTVTVTGTSGSQTVTTTLTLGVYAQSFTLSAGSVGIGQGSSNTSYVYVYDQYGFTGSVNLAVSGLPSGVTAAWSTNPTTYSSVLTLTASSSAAVGQYNATITGTSGSVTATTILSIGIFAPTFTLSACCLTLNQGSSGQSSISLFSDYGFNGNVSLAVSGLPSGVTASFAPNPVAVSSTSYSTSSVLTLTATNTAAAGNATVTITGTSGSTTATTTLSVTVNPQSFKLSDAPSELTLAQGGSDASTVYVNPVNGFAGSVTLAVSGLPSGVTGSFSPNPTTGSSVLTLTASGSASAGSSTATITGTSGALTATTPLPVTVRSAPAATSTTLAVTSGGAVTSVASGSLVTLTATVAAGSTPLTTGQVNFCDAATYCEDMHLLGTAQLTGAGTAVLRFFPGMGSHSYTAVFAGTKGYATSASGAASLNVTASNASTTSIAASGAVGDYSVTATVTAQGLVSPTGTVSFLDTTSANAAVGTAALAPSKTALAWLNSQSPATGVAPYAIASGDFNLDGIPDLAVANATSNTVTILLGKGDGTFSAAAASPSTGSNPFSMTVADFNGDGKPDLAVANLYGSTLTILLGNGDGTFTQSASPSTGTYPISVAAGDFNGDGIPDLAAANEDSSTVTILLGNGDGTFTPAASPATGSYPRSVAVGDFNGDGIPDLAVANEISYTVTILLGNGDGTFTPSPVSPQTGTDPFSVVVGDFNRDGIKDLAVVNAGGTTLTILLGNGNGTFTPAASPVISNFQPSSIALGDFNGDGKPDLAVSNYQTNYATILLGNGDGTFAVSGTVTTGSSPWGVVAGQFNKNGYPGLAVSSSGSNSVAVLTAQLTQTATATATGVSPVGSGTHLVDASYPGDSDYAASVSGTTGLTAQPVTLKTPSVLVTPSPLSITPIQALTVAVAVSGGSGNPTPTGAVTLTSGSYTSAPTSLSSGSATIAVPAGSLAVGTDTLSVAYTPDANSSTSYTNATGTNSVSVNLIPPTISFSVPNRTYGDAPFSVAATSNSTGAFTYSVVSGPATISGSTVTLTGAGSVVLQASETAAGNYSAGTQTATFAVAAEAPTISFSVPNHAYGDAPFTVAATSNSMGTFTYSVVSGPATIAGSTVTLTGAGTVVLQASEAAAGNYSAGNQTATFTVAAAGGPTIVFSVPNHTYGDAPFTVAATSNSSGAFTYSVVSGPATISGATVTLTGAGVVVLLASQAATANYAAGTQTATFTVAAAAPTIIFSVPNHTYGDAPFSVGATSNSTGTFTYSVVSGPATIAGSTVALTGAGMVVLQASQAATANYAAGTQTATFTVAAAAPTIIFSVPNHTYGDAPFTVAATSNSSGAFTYSVVSGPATISGSAVTLTGPGTVVLQASQAAAGNYSAGNQTATFTVAAAGSPAIVFSVPNHTYGDPPFTVAATSNSSGAFTYSVVSGPATISGSTVTLTGAGTVVLQASQAAAGNFAAGTQTASFSVATESQSIAFTAPASPVSYGVAQIALSASASSGLAVTLSVLSGPASISGSTLTITGAGTVVVAANQAGNTNYAPAAQVTQSIVVNKIAPAVGLTPSLNPIFAQNTLTLTAAVTSSVGTPSGSVVFSDGGSALGTATISAGVAALPTSTLSAGAHSITAMYSGDGNFLSVTSAAVAETVEDFTFAPGSSGSTQTVQPGGTATYTFSVSPTGGNTLPSAVTFSDSGLLAGYTATFSPASLAAGGVGTTVTLTVQVPQTARLEPSGRPGGSFPIVALGLLLLPFGCRFRRASNRLGRLSILALLFSSVSIVAALTGCAGGGGNGGNGVESTSQTSTITVTATSGALSHSSTLTLTVP